MFRGARLLDGIRDLVPDWGVVLAAVVTQLGDGWWLLALGLGASWATAWRRRGRPGHRPGVGRSDGPWFLAVIVGGLAVMTALKHFFALPRPDLGTVVPAWLPSSLEPLYRSVASAGGYGFPSGHAVGATVTYGLFALILEAGTRRLRLAVATSLVAAVSATRLVLGVHYPLDVVAGVVVGGAYLAVAWRLLERSPFDRTITASGLALTLAGVAGLTSGGADSAVGYVALVAGALAGWLGGQALPMPTAGRYHTGVLLLAIGALTTVGVSLFDGRARLVASATLLGLLAGVPTAVLSRSNRGEPASD
ncbi:phosphoesterase PA-phosphatase-related protein [Natrinema pellirubrum DSM 15624]|uniref:Membrane-associated phospholipid phosphatase n=1 Tax=Natrinema pellirubrum (strain DSM 15624 / CIP 106293 / JCM 10476 / NCIMB 786 / 157) TaxID=797303 RepID=L0JS35_NATP1|nr:phosphatase PAP2 family protein [Natrinema pellirubrum]AGB33196.1 membrane-associated phospholipid phosphatase [Natrinema pellirubrum DSM 15624]ELY71861.1 phosphoesterase PA-phosphatase-related protein [Natrinema pellirubrum DSM 15624]